MHGTVSYLEVLEIVRVPRPVDLSEEILVEHLAQQFKQVDFALVVRLHSSSVRRRHRTNMENHGENALDNVNYGPDAGEKSGRQHKI